MNKRLWTVAVVLVSLVIVSNLFPGSAKAWTGTYHLDREWTKIWINPDGSIDLFYNITLTLDSGDNINFITVGQPNAYYTIGQAFDQYNNTLSATDARQGKDYKVQVNLNTALTAGHTVWFTLLTHVGHMIYLDMENLGNVGMQFTPSWYSAPVENVSVSILLPAGVEENMTVTSRDWSNTFMEEGRLTVYWEAANLSPGEQFPVGVSFPKEYVKNYDTGSSEGQVAIEPTADTYVDYDNQNSNYGGQNGLYVEKDQVLSLYMWERRIWLKFNLSSIPDGAEVDNATLRLYCYWASETYNVYAHSSSDISWAEFTLTWSNMPSYNTTSLDMKQVATPYTWYDWSVTYAVQKAVDGIQGGPGVVTIVLLETSLRGLVSSVSFYSKEDISYYPELVVHWSGIVPEFPSIAVTTLLMIATLFVATVYQRKMQKRTRLRCWRLLFSDARAKKQTSEGLLHHSFTCSSDQLQPPLSAHICL